MQNENEGTVNLSPDLKEQEEKAKAEAARKKEIFKAVNLIVNETLSSLKKDHNLNIVMIAEIEDENEVGIWKTQDLSFTKEMGLMSLVARRVNT